ncbi:MAG TPA: hypothetical protein VFF06_26275 [Polyangia bacterium]|nr:hypothetical protein [Polyangia bacterium]
MPAPQLHLTFAELLSREPRLDGALRAACRAEPRYTRLGAIFHDLAYYGNMALMAVRYGLRLPAEESPWGARVHEDRPDEFLARFVATARSIDNALTRDERLAIVAGLCSHVALDLSLHPLVNFLARRDRREQGGAESHHHRLAEKYHALFYHLDSTGRDLIGSGAELHEKTTVTKRSSLVWLAVEAPLVELALASYRAMWNDAPSRRQWMGWVRSFAHFGRMVGHRWALRNSLRLRTSANRRRYFICPEFNFYDFWEAGRLRGIHLANRACAFFERADFSDDARADFIRDVAFDGTLTDPIGRHGPKLPAVCGKVPHEHPI